MTHNLEENSRFSKASHLTEFYPYLINNANDLSLAKASPTISHTRTNSIANTIGTINTTTTLQSIITKSDIQKTSAIYDEILTASEEYRNSLRKVSETSANLGNALEKLSKLKGSGDINGELLNFSGFFFLISNHEEILNQSIKQQFEIPITKEVNNFNLKISKNDEIFKSDYKQLLKELKQKEKENLKLSKSKFKSLNLYKSKLIQLTSHLESIEQLKHQYYQDSYELVESSNKKILTHLGTVIRAEIEIDENIARKGWSGGGLDDLIAKCPDPFNPDEDEELEENDVILEDENEPPLGNDSSSHKPNSPSPFSTLKNGDTNELGDSSTDENLNLDNQRTSCDSTLKLPKTPRSSQGLKHQQSVRSLTKDHLDDQSTPIGSIKSFKIGDKTDIGDNYRENSAVFHGRDVSNIIASLQLEDDNSFSLPLPGSSSKITSKNLDETEPRDVLTELKNDETGDDKHEIRERDDQQNHQDHEDEISDVNVHSDQHNEWLQD